MYIYIYNYLFPCIFDYSLLISAQGRPEMIESWSRRPKASFKDCSLRCTYFSWLDCNFRNDVNSKHDHYVYVYNM